MVILSFHIMRQHIFFLNCTLHTYRFLGFYGKYLSSFYHYGKRRYSTMMERTGKYFKLSGTSLLFIYSQIQKQVQSVIRFHGSFRSFSIPPKFKHVQDKFKHIHKALLCNSKVSKIKRHPNCFLIKTILTQRVLSFKENPAIISLASMSKDP